jgi:hypothetical protein
MVHVKYVTRDTGRRPLLWWFPYDRELRTLAATALRALHGTGAAARAASLLRLATFRRLRQRADLGALVRHPDKLL